MTGSYQRLIDGNVAGVGQVGYWTAIDGHQICVRALGRSFCQWSLWTEDGRVWVDGGNVAEPDLCWQTACAALDELTAEVTT